MPPLPKFLFGNHNFVFEGRESVCFSYYCLNIPSLLVQTVIIVKAFLNSSFKCIDLLDGKIILTDMIFHLK